MIIRGAKSTRFFQEKSKSLLLCLVLGGLASFFLASCATTKNVTYFRDVPDTLKHKIIEQAAYATPVIQPDDILQVTVQTLDPGATALLNQTNTPSWPVAGTATNPATPSIGGANGYLVDKDGQVILPLIGKVTVKGKTTNEVRDDIRNKAAEFYKDPVVNVRFANFKVTVLGEVARPATYVMPNEKVTLLDAIGMAGDLTIYGKRENILLIREEDGKKEFVRFNLNDSKLFSSPYFYLHQGDVVYIEPNKSRVASSDAAQLRRFTVLASVLSLLIVIATRVKF